MSKLNDLIKEISIDKGIENTVNAIAENDSGILIKKGQNKDVVQTVQLPDNINAPVSAGQVLGNITYSLNDVEVGKVNIIAEKSVNKNSSFNVIKYVIFNWLSLLRYNK